MNTIRRPAATDPRHMNRSMQPPGDVRDLASILKAAYRCGVSRKAVALLGDRTGDGNIVGHPNDVDLPSFKWLRLASAPLGPAAAVQTASRVLLHSWLRNEGVPIGLRELAVTLAQVV